jgi:hypothetical protein
LRGAVPAGGGVEARVGLIGKRRREPEWTPESEPLPCVSDGFCVCFELGERPGPYWWLYVGLMRSGAMEDANGSGNGFNF